MSTVMVLGKVVRNGRRLGALNACKFLRWKRGGSAVHCRGSIETVAYRRIMAILLVPESYMFKFVIEEDVEIVI